MKRIFFIIGVMSSLLGFATSAREVTSLRISATIPEDTAIDFLIPTSRIPLLMASSKTSVIRVGTLRAYSNETDVNFSISFKSNNGSRNGYERPVLMNPNGETLGYKVQIGNTLFDTTSGVLLSGSTNMPQENDLSIIVDNQMNTNLNLWDDLSLMLNVE